MDAFTLYRNSVARVPGWQDSYDRLNLSGISLETSELSTHVQDDMIVIAPSFLSNAQEPSPVQSPTSSHEDSIDTTSSSAYCSPENSENRGPQSSSSRTSRRKRFRAPPTKASMAEADKRRSKVLAKNCMAARPQIGTVCDRKSTSRTSSGDAGRRLSKDVSRAH
jgi:hypothetical protein